MQNNNYRNGTDTTFEQRQREIANDLFQSFKT